MKYTLIISNFDRQAQEQLPGLGQFLRDQGFPLTMVLPLSFTITQKKNSHPWMLLPVKSLHPAFNMFTPDSIFRKSVLTFFPAMHHHLTCICLQAILSVMNSVPA